MHWVGEMTVNNALADSGCLAEVPLQADTPNFII